MSGNSSFPVLVVYCKSGINLSAFHVWSQFTRRTAPHGCTVLGSISKTKMPTLWESKATQQHEVPGGVGMLVLGSQLQAAGSPGGELCMQVSPTRWQHMSSRKPLATCLERLRSRKGVTQGSSVPSHFPQRNFDPEMRCATPNICTLVVTTPQSNTHPPHASLSGPFSELIPPLCGLHWAQFKEVAMLYSEKPFPWRFK